MAAQLHGFPRAVKDATVTLMILRSLFVALALVFTAALPAPVSATPATCQPSVQDRLWMQQAMNAWYLVAHDKLSIYAADPPDFVFFDGNCTFQTGSAARGKPFAGPRYFGRRISWKADFHGRTIALPGGGDLPVGVASFAAPYDNDTKAFMVMALPSIWRDGDVRSAMGLETLMTGVFVHEMTHTRQFYAFSPRIAALTARYHLPDDINDDSLQDAFKENPDYVAAWTLERDLLLQAANEPDDAKARALVRQAFEQARTRPARFFTGENEKWEGLDDAFLTMEGMGQWAAYSWLIDPKGGGVDPARALPLFRRGGRFWTQDQGLLVMLAVQRFVPRWREYAFDAQPELIMRLWGRAAYGETEPVT